MERFQNTRQPDWDWWGRLWPAPGETLRELGIGPDDSIAEVGSGNGYFALPAARIVSPAPVYAIDLDTALLDELRDLASLQGIDNIVPIEGDARALTDLLPERVDMVLLANAFHGVDDRDLFIREAVEALSPGGRFIVVNWVDRSREETVLDGASKGPPTELRLSPAETSQAVLDVAPVTVSARVDLPPYHYGIVFERHDDASEDDRRDSAGEHGSP